MHTFAYNEIKIISRSQWWADENIRFVDSPEWKKILEEREKIAIKNKDIVYTQAQLDAQKISQDRRNKINELFNKYSYQTEISNKITHENGRKLFWPIEKAKKIWWIVIHHTGTDYETSLEWVRNIYKYHTLTNGWWDIWYNYIIWKDGEIYEWRAWWDYVVWAHNKYNNIWTVWISIIWNYTEKPINSKQYESLKSLTSHLIKKYDIDLTKKMYYHKECVGRNCELPLITESNDFLIWHRDAWHTDCPWEELYKQIQNIKTDLLKQKSFVSSWNLYKKNIFKTLEKIPDDKLIDILANIEMQLDIKKDSSKLNLKLLIIDYFKERKNTKNTIVNKKEEIIDIKLSYPNNDNIKIKTGNITIDISREWNDLYLKWKKFNTLKIPKKDQESILEIISWERIPLWDKQKRYNDNKFRWDLILYVKDEKLVVINRINVEDYLKWLWEVSDYETPEKIKAIIIAARSYAIWYKTKDRKFPWEDYDWIDDPEVFQRYLWYGLEARSPNINKVVDETKWQIITYKWEIIKPWYFSTSNWKTLSYYEYCRLKYSDAICSKEAKKYPYLQSVYDIWSKWQQSAWHWVWISWAWVKYFADKWWTFDMIIKYYLKWVDVL